ncbi:MAG: lactonase family protein [Alphaproteobacteria bacterium]|nr:lactonase family protein [Alphaproteobacteria bacterium]
MRKEKILMAVAALALLGSAGGAQAGRAYIGTYTQEPTARGNNHGEGIYLVDIDDASGAVSNPTLVAKMKSPAWIAFSPNKRFLYANSEIFDYEGKTGSVTAFAVDAGMGALRPLNVVSSGAAGPAYIEIDRSGKFALVANYSGGSFAVIHIKDDGSLGELADQVKPDGPLNPAEASDTQPGQFAGSDHSGSHGHMIGMDPSGKYVIGDDAGRDQIFVWTLDAGGKLHQVSVTKSLPGSAPRHFVFSPDGKMLYQLQEQDSRLQAYDFKDGVLTVRGGSIFTLPDGYQGSNTTSELLINKAGTRLYAANRTQDSIATITAGKSGVSRIANTHTGADNPRSLALNPNGKFLYSLNQTGNNVVTFRIGPRGVPQPTGSVMALGSPAVMVFLPN